MHVDHAVALSDFDATPRRDVVSIWLWLSDVEEERAAMRIGAHGRSLGVFSRGATSLTSLTPDGVAVAAPGSHRYLGAHWERMKAAWRQGQPLPLPPDDGRGTGEPVPGEADLSPYAHIEPRAVVAKRGEALVFVRCSPPLHSRATAVNSADAVGGGADAEPDPRGVSQRWHRAP